jgi:hypothetical protein
MRDRARNSVRGRKAKSVGDAFEAEIERHHAEAMKLGILAHVVHNEPTAEFLGGKLVYTSPGVSDYTGVLEGGTATTLAVEAKSEGVELGKAGYLSRKRVSDKQQIHLNAVAKAGGLALLLVEFRVQSPFIFGLPITFYRFAVPWLEVPWAVKKTAQSVDMSALRPEWAFATGEKCYLMRYRSPGSRSSMPPGRVHSRG